MVASNLSTVFGDEGAKVEPIFFMTGHKKVGPLFFKTQPLKKAPNFSPAAGIPPSAGLRPPLSRNPRNAPGISHLAVFIHNKCK